MDSLISKHEVLGLIKNMPSEDCGSTALLYQGVKQMDDCLIRCKDCKHRPSGTGVNHDLEFPHNDYKCPCRCEDYWYSWKPADDWYCANGERRLDI